MKGVAVRKIAASVKHCRVFQERMGLWKMPGALFWSWL